MANTVYVVKIDTVPTYIGTTTTTLEERLHKHITASKSGTSKWYLILRGALEMGCAVTIEALEHNAPDDAEYVWVDTLQCDGYALANSKNGNRGKPINEHQLKKNIREWKRLKKRKPSAGFIPVVDQKQVKFDYDRIKAEMIAEGTW